MTIKTAVILAAGRGSRLKSLTKMRSKAMMPIVGKPMVELVISVFISNGINDFIIVANPNDHHLINHLTGLDRLDISIQFVYQDHPKGTAHALNLASPYLQQDFIISACDNIVPASHVMELMKRWNDYQPLNGILSLMSGSKENLSGAALVELDSNYITRIIEKPSPDEVPSNITSIPLYCFSPRILQYLNDVPVSNRGEFELQDAIQMLINNDGYVCGVFTKFRQTVSCANDLLHVNIWYLNHYNLQVKKIPKNIDSDSKFFSPVHIEDGSVIGQNCSIGPNVFIETGSIIEDNVVISDSVILHGARVIQGSSVKNQITF